MMSPESAQSTRCRALPKCLWCGERTRNILFSWLYLILFFAYSTLFFLKIRGEPSFCIFGGEHKRRTIFKEGGTRIKLWYICKELLINKALDPTHKKRQKPWKPSVQIFFFSPYRISRQTVILICFLCFTVWLVNTDNPGAVVFNMLPASKSYENICFFDQYDEPSKIILCFS